MRSPATKEKYLIRLGKFLNFLNFEGTIEDKARAFAEKGKDDSIWSFNGILKFIQFQKEAYSSGELSISKDCYLRELSIGVACPSKELSRREDCYLRL